MKAIAHRVAQEHIGWCVCAGMTPNDVCESVGAYLTAPSWGDARRVLAKRWVQMQDGQHPLPIISDRRVA